MTRESQVEDTPRSFVKSISIFAGFLHLMFATVLAIGLIIYLCVYYNKDDDNADDVSPTGLPSVIFLCVFCVSSMIFDFLLIQGISEKRVVLIAFYVYVNYIAVCIIACLCIINIVRDIKNHIPAGRFLIHHILHALILVTMIYLVHPVYLLYKQMRVANQESEESEQSEQPVQSEQTEPPEEAAPPAQSEQSQQTEEFEQPQQSEQPQQTKEPQQSQPPAQFEQPAQPEQPEQPIQPKQPVKPDTIANSDVNISIANRDVNAEP